MAGGLPLVEVRYAMFLSTGHENACNAACVPFHLASSSRGIVGIRLLYLFRLLSHRGRRWFPTPLTCRNACYRAPDPTKRKALMYLRTAANSWGVELLHTG